MTLTGADIRRHAVTPVTLDIDEARRVVVPAAQLGGRPPRPNADGVIAVARGLGDPRRTPT